MLLFVKLPRISRINIANVKFIYYLYKDIIFLN